MSYDNKKIAVIGAGSFGTALAITLAGRGHRVTMWARRAEQIDEMQAEGTNSRYLPEIRLPEEIAFTKDLSTAVQDKNLLLFAVPAQKFREVFGEAMKYADAGVPVVNVAKGIEKGTLLRLSEIAGELAPGCNYIALSGPSHAEEVARRMPTTVVVAGKNHELAVEIQEIFSTDRFRVYTNEDLTGVELGGALKNIIALGAGISDGLGFGDNAKAALMTRGLAEITRLGLALGARHETFAGLTGTGDLIVTCTSMHSRNRRCGIMIGEGMAPDEATKKVGMVVEGMFTTEAAYELAARENIEMPITEAIYRVIRGDMKATDAVDLLMGRDKKHEQG